MRLVERYRGALLGLATGDAMGASVEFMRPGTFEPLTGMRGGGPHGLTPGQWTDDTSLALCLAESLVRCNGFDPADQMRRYLRWYREGYLSSTGNCFDIGNSTRKAIEHFERTGEPFAGIHDPHGAGNGSLMRLAPVPLAFADTPCKAVYLAGKSSLTTHGSHCAADACRLLAHLLVSAVEGQGRDDLMKTFSCASPTGTRWDPPLCVGVQKVADGSFLFRSPPLIEASGYSVKSLEAALWAFFGSTTFEQGMLLAVNLGDDADSVGAIYGQLAGAFYGERAIPSAWLEPLAMRERILELAEGLHEMAT